MRRFALAILCVLMLCTAVFAADVQVDTMSIDCVVDENGTARVSSTLHLTLEGSPDSLTIGLGPDVSGARAEGYAYKARRRGGATELVISSENGLPASMDLNLFYTVRNTVDADAGGQEFSIRLLGGIDGDIAACDLKLTMPKAFAATPSFVSGYYADGIDNYMDISVADGVLTASFTQPMLAGETLDLQLQLEAGYFTLHNVAGRTLKADRILLLVLLALALLYWLRFLRCGLPRAQRRPHPPAGVGPGEAGTLLTRQAPDLALMAVNWAANGYLHITRTRHNQVYLEQLMPMGNERSPYEATLFRQLFQRDTVVDAKALQRLQPESERVVAQYWNHRLYRRRGGSTAVLRALGVVFGAVCGLYFADSVLPSMSLRYLPLAGATALFGVGAGLLQYGLLGMMRRRKKRPALALALTLLVLLVLWQLLGGLGALLLLIVSQLLVAAGTNFGPRRSENGLAVQNQLLGYRLYLRSLRPEDAQALLEQDPLYFYKYLPFALALGVGRRFSAAFAGSKLELCGFYDVQRKGTPRQAEEFCASLCRTLAILRGEDRPGLLRCLRRRKKAKPAPRTQSSRSGGSQNHRRSSPTGSARPHRNREYDEP